MLTLTYEYKLAPTHEQVQKIEHTINVCRKVWNFALRERKDWLNSRKCPVNACSITSEYIIRSDTPYPNYFEQAKSLTSEFQRWYPPRDLSVESIQNPKSKILKPPHLSVGSI